MTTDDSIERSVHETQMEQCNAYIFCQLQGRKKSVGSGRPIGGPAVTISHQTGSGAHEIAEELARILQAAEPKAAVPWTVFDRQLVETVLAEHNLPLSLARLMPEERRSYLRELTEEYLGMRPPSWALVPKIAETVLHLANAGHVILVGRGANLITARLPNMFHVRLVAPLPQRIARTQTQNKLTPKEAAALVAKSDRGRSGYLQAHFQVAEDDDLLYHLTINTDLLTLPVAAQLIADGVRRCLQADAKGRKPG